MDFYRDAPAWDDEQCPSKAPNAKPNNKMQVSKVAVIQAPEGAASYRNANFGGTFILADEGEQLEIGNGIVEVPVFCLWFDHRLHKFAPTFKFDMSKCRTILNFSGEVATNLQS